MATLLGGSRSAVRIGVHRWRDCGLALIVAAAVIGGSGEARAAVVPGQDVSVGVHQQGSSTASMNGSSMQISTSMVATVAMAGVAAASIAIPAVRVVQVGADVMGVAGRMAMRSGLPQAAMVAIIASMAGSDLAMGPDGTVSVAQHNPNQGDNGFDGSLWISGNKTGNSPVAACSAYVSVAYPGMVITGYGGNGYCQGTLPPGSSMSCGGGVCNISVGHAGGCVDGYVAAGSGCAADPNAPVTYTPATDAQIEAAMRAHPEAWPQTFNAAGCGKANSFMDAASANLDSDPCAVIIVGSVPQSNGVTWPNGNTATFPPRTTTTTGTDAQGRPTMDQQTTTTSVTLNGTNSRTAPVSATPTTTTTSTSTTTNADGSTTSSTTTTTTTSPAQDGTDDQAATFDAPDIQLYKQKSKTFADVLTGFRTRVAAMPWYTAMVGFFSVTISSGACPHWVVPASRWNQSLSGDAFFCSSTAMGWYQAGGIVVLIVAAWAAFRIAFL